MGISGLARRIKRGETPFYARLKRMAKGVMQFHIPVVSVTRPIFSGLYWAHVFLRETGIGALRFFWYEPLFRSRCENVGLGFQMEKLPYMTGSGRIVIGEGVRLSGKSGIGFNNRLQERPELIVGDGTFIGHGCSFAVAKSVRIGKHCLLASGVSVSDNDGHPIDVEKRRAGEPVAEEQAKEVVIEDDAWIGRGATILKGVRVGQGVIVGAQAVVTKDVPAFTVVAGNPAKVIKELPHSKEEAAGNE